MSRITKIGLFFLKIGIDLLNNFSELCIALTVNPLPLTVKHKNMRKLIPIIQTLICYLFIVLFVYAAVSKLIDFLDFSNSIGQSTFVSKLCDSYFVWNYCYRTCNSNLFDVWNGSEEFALQISLFLMVMFTTYNYQSLDILHGIYPLFLVVVFLEKLGWDRTF